MVNIKRIIAFIGVMLLLVGCGNSVHENIDTKMAEDTKQILNIFDKAVKETRSLTDDERFIADDYVLLYNSKKNHSEYSTGGLTKEEERLLFLVENMVGMADTLTLIESNHESYKNQKALIKNVIKSGTVHGG